MGFEQIFREISLL